MNELRALLKKSTKKELEGLAKILNAKDATPDSIIDSLWWNSQSIFGYLVGHEPSYKDIVRQVANKLKIKYKDYNTPKEIEIKITQKVIETAWEKMTPEQREKMEEQLRKTAQKFDKTGALATSASIFGSLTAAQLSGFGVYLLASTALGFVTDSIGLTLPFVVYTTMSSTIAVIIGPVGWIGAGLFAIWKLTGPNYKRLIPAIIYICALRSKKEARYMTGIMGRLITLIVNWLDYLRDLRKRFFMARKM